MKILLVDDHALYRDGLRLTLTTLANDTEVLETGSGSHAMRLLAHEPDVKLVVLDLKLPDGDGLGILTEIRKRHPGLQVVILSAIEDRETFRRAFALGAAGFILKSYSREVILGALRFVLAGGVFVPPEVLAGEAPAIDELRRQATIKQQAPSPRDLGLPDRHINVLALIVQGKSNKDIAISTGLAEATVKRYVSEILAALKVNNRTEAAFTVNELGWKLQGSGTS
jgi:DNA-binding NarL/FixJ family response regulator